ncbi:MAG: glycosyltransferase family 4 protein [Kiritimatiellae bacterium]|nr:glycosyltransferase family 4 protein [Kiritimatiellia bacterium]
MKQRKILWVNPSFLDYRIPFYDEMNKCCNGGFHLIYSKNRVPERCRLNIGRRLGGNAIGIEKEVCYGSATTAEFANRGVTIPFPKGLYRKIASVEPDLLVAEGFFQFTPWALLYSIVHRKPLLIAYERTAHTERNCPFWRTAYRRFVNLFVDGYVVNGRLTKEYLMSHGVREESIFTGGMCADSTGLADSVTAFSSCERDCFRNQVFGSRVSGLIYIYVGQMIHRKGVSSLIEGWRTHIAKHGADKLLLVGDGPELENCRKIAETMGSIVFAGAVDYSLIHKYYAISDVFVMPTLEDNWSLVVPEAMACGLPVACSIYNGCHPELVRKDVNGITFDPLLPESVVMALDYFHNADLRKLGRASIEIERNYNPAHVAANVMRAIDSCL